MNEAFILMLEIAVFGLVLWAVGRKLPPGTTRDLGILSYRETIDAPSDSRPPPTKAAPRA